MPESLRRPRGRRTRSHRRSGGVLLIVLGATLLVLGSSLGPAAAATSAADLCDSGTMDVEHRWEPSRGDWVLTRLVLDELGASCDGVVVAVHVLANATGDTSQPSTVAAELFSDEDPCTGATLDPVVGSVRNASLTLDFCASGPDVTTFEVTGFRFFTALPAPRVLDADEEPDPGVDGTNVLGEQEGRGRLPTTGSSPLGGALIGMAAVLIGIGLLRIVRPGRREVVA